MSDTGESLDKAPTVEQPVQPPVQSHTASTPNGPIAAQGGEIAATVTASDEPDASEVTWTGVEDDARQASWADAFPVGEEAQAASEPPRHKHDAPVDAPPGSGRHNQIMFVVGAVLAVLGTAAAIFGLQAIVSSSRADSEATARAEAYAEIEEERADHAEEALSRVFSVIDVTDAVSEVLESGNAFREAGDKVVEVTNQAVALEDEGKSEEAVALMVEQGANAFSEAAVAQQSFHEAVTRLQELLQ